MNAGGLGCFRDGYLKMKCFVVECDNDDVDAGECLRHVGDGGVVRDVEDDSTARLESIELRGGLL